MKSVFHLIVSSMLVLPISQIWAQELISIHPQNPGEKTEWYETVDENSKPKKISCETGGGGNYRLKLSEARTVEEDFKLDTIKTDKEEWTEEDEKEFDKKYNKEHQKELDDLWKQIVDAPQDIQAACKEKLEDFIDTYWNHSAYSICEPDCKSPIQLCYIFYDIISIGDSKVEYRYKTNYSYLTEKDPPPHEVEMEFDLEIYYEAWIYFKVGCACQDIPDLVSVTPEEKGKDPATLEDSGTMAVQMNPENSNQLTDVFITAKGTGRTTGNIAIITVENKSKTTLAVLPQTAYIPSSGQYQPYIAIIPGTTLSPGTTIIPVTGYCADVHKPPVANGDPMPPIEEWIPVGDPNAPIPEGSVNIIPTIPVLPFSPDDIPEILTSPEYESTSTSDSDTPIIITWPGTDIPVGGTLVPGENPEQFAPVIVEVFEEVTEAVDVIQRSGKYTTPFSADTVKEDQAVTQNVIWIYTAELSGNSYEKDDFGTNLYKQFENTTGRTVASLPEEQKDKIDEGIDDFWNVFTAVGVEAKVISETSPGIELDPTMLASVRTPQCACKSISYDLEVKRGGVVVHDENHKTPVSPRVSIAGFAFGDVLSIKLSNIQAHCNCDDAECLFYPAESTNPNSPSYTDTDRTRPGKVDIEMDNDPAGEIGSKGNNNCQNKDKTFNGDGTEYTFTLETRDEGTNMKAVFQKLRIKSYCELEDCGRKLCAKYIQLSFVPAN